MLFLSRSALLALLPTEVGPSGRSLGRLIGFKFKSLCMKKYYLLGEVYSFIKLPGPHPVMW